MTDAPEKPIYVAIRYCFISNAGAMIALLAFLGQVWDSPSTDIDLDPETIVSSFTLFVGGLIAAILAFMGLYFGNEYKKAAWLAKWGAPICCIASIALFVLGGLASADWLVRGSPFLDPGFLED